MEELMEEKEVELIDYLNVIWKRKWIIIIGTVLCMIIAGAVSFISKPVYEIDSIIQPGKFIVQNQEGNFEEFVVEDPPQIADKVEHKSYDALIAVELNLDVAELPEIKGENIRDTLLTRLWIRNHDIKLSKKILDSLIVLLKSDIDEKIDIEINNIETQIKSRERAIESEEISINSKKIQKERVRKDISTLGSKLKVIDKRKEEIMVEMKEVKERIDNLEKNQVAILKKENKSESETLGLLLYSTEVQKNLQYYNYLQEMFSNKEINEEDVKMQIEKEKEAVKLLDNQIEDINNEIENIKNQIANLEERKGRIDYTKVIKKPTSSMSPVFPKKKLNVLIACILGSMVFTLLAFFLEYREKYKKRTG